MLYFFNRQNKKPGATLNPQIPKHIGVIPDGNRRWSDLHNLSKEDGYKAGYLAMKNFVMDCKEIGIQEITAYGCSNDNLKRTVDDKKHFIKCIYELASYLKNKNIDVRLIGNHNDPNFPGILKDFNSEQPNGNLKVNVLVDYSFEWDLQTAIKKLIASSNNDQKYSLNDLLETFFIPPVDLLLRWGNSYRLSGFLPYQTEYADLYFFNKLWPEYTRPDLNEALAWYSKQIHKHGL